MLFWAVLNSSLLKISDASVSDLPLAAAAASVSTLMSPASSGGTLALSSESDLFRSPALNPSVPPNSAGSNARLMFA